MLNSQGQSEHPRITKQPLISIISAVYNAEKYFEESLLGISAQSYKNFEYIVVDGGSTDNTLNIIKKYQDKITYWISEPDQGIYDAWNKGLAVANGDWIAFVGADDILYKHALETYVNHILLHQQDNYVDFISSYIELVTEDLKFIRTIGGVWNWEKFRSNMNTGHVGCFHAKSLFTKYGSYDISYKISGDYELLLRAKENLKAAFIPVPTVRMRTGGVSASQLEKAIEETYKAKAKNGVLSPLKAKSLTIVDKIRTRLNI